MKITDVLGFVRDLFSLAEETHKNTAAIEKLEEEMDRLSRIVDRLIQQSEHTKEVERLEREKMMLQIQNVLTQFDRRLP